MKNQKLTVNPDRFSAKARDVWNMLEERQKEIIQKDHIFKPARNNEIIKLKKAGAANVTLCEISGLGRSQISRITKGMKFWWECDQCQASDEISEAFNQHVKELDKNIIQMKGSVKILKALNQQVRDLAGCTRQIKEFLENLGQGLNDIARGLEEIQK